MISCVFSHAAFPTEQVHFKAAMQEYLFSPEGKHYLHDIRVEGNILDLKGDFTIVVSCSFTR